MSRTADVVEHARWVPLIAQLEDDEHAARLEVAETLIHRACWHQLAGRPKSAAVLAEEAMRLLKEAHGA